MRGRVSLVEEQEGDYGYAWSAMAIKGHHCIVIKTDLAKRVKTRARARRCAREAGLMVQKIMGVK